MNWDAIGAVAELLGSLAVFLTLIYLAVQVRHARQDVRSHPFIAALIENAQFSPSDAWAVFMELNAEWQYRVQVVSNIEGLSDGERLKFDNAVRAMYGKRALTKAWYQTHGKNLNPEVVAYVDRLLQ